MTQPQYHGLKLTLSVAIATSLAAVNASAIGMIVTSDDANAVYELNKAVEVSDFSDETKFGTTGTFKNNMQAVTAQGIAPKIVVVRVAEGADEAETETNTMAGLEALSLSISSFGYQLNRFAAPGLESETVNNKLADIAENNRGMSYAAIAGADVDAAIVERNKYDSAYIEGLWPTTHKMGDEDINVAALAVATRAKIDSDEGITKTISNREVKGIDATSIDIAYKSDDSIAQKLHRAQLTTVINRDGKFLFFNNYNLSKEGLMRFETDTLINNYVMDVVEQQTNEAGFGNGLDATMDENFISDFVQLMKQVFNNLEREGIIIGGDFWLNENKNTAEVKANGENYFNSDYTAPAPFQNPNIEVAITNKYYV